MRNVLARTKRRAPLVAVAAYKGAGIKGLARHTFRLLRFMVCSVFLAALLVACGMVGTAQAEEYSYEFDLTDIDGNSIINGGSFDANVLNQGLYFHLLQYSGFTIPGYFVYITDMENGTIVVAGGFSGKGVTEGFYNPNTLFYSYFVGGHTYEIQIRIRTWEEGHAFASNYQIIIATHTYYLTTAAETPPETDDTDSESDNLATDGDGQSETPALGDDGNSGSGDGMESSGQDTSTDSYGDDDLTGSGGDDDFEDNTAASLLADSDSSAFDSGSGWSATSSITDSMGLDDTALSSGSTASSESSSSAALDTQELVSLGTVYRVGSITGVTESDEEQDASSALLVQFQVYGWPLVVLVMALLFFGAAPAGFVTRLGRMAFASRIRSRLT